MGLQPPAVQGPASSILGTGLYGPRLANAPFNAADVVKSPGRRIVQLAAKSTPWLVPGTFTTYLLPDNLEAVRASSTNTQYNFFQDSRQAVGAIEQDASLRESYLAFSGNASSAVSLDTVDTAIQNAFETNNYLALFACTISRYSVSLEDSAAFPDLFETTFAAELSALPRPFSFDKTETRHAYQEFLYRWGTHMFTEVAFGQRFFFHTAQPSSSETSFSDFQTSISTEYSGFSQGLSGNASFKTTKTYKTFLQQSTQYTVVAGGNSNRRKKLSADPTDLNSFTNWANDYSIASQDTPIRLTIKSLGEVLRLKSASKLSAYADDIDLAIAILIDETRDTIVEPNALWESGPLMFVKVKDSATGAGNCSLIFSDDDLVKVTPIKDQKRGWGGTVTSEGFEYGPYGRSISFSGFPLRESQTGLPGFDAGHLTRFNLSYGLTTTITLFADENIEYVIFASGQYPYEGDGLDYRRRSRHVYFDPSTDPNPLKLTSVDLGIGAMSSRSLYGPRNQFSLWDQYIGRDLVQYIAANTKAVPI